MAKFAGSWHLRNDDFWTPPESLRISPYGKFDERAAPSLGGTRRAVREFTVCVANNW
jgi:hypothetical protein